MLDCHKLLDVSWTLSHGFELKTDIHPSIPTTNMLPLRVSVHRTLRSDVPCFDLDVINDARIHHLQDESYIVAQCVAQSIRPTRKLVSSLNEQRLYGGDDELVSRFPFSTFRFYLSYIRVYHLLSFHANTISTLLLLNDKLALVCMPD